MRDGLDALTVALAEPTRRCWTLAGPATAAWWRRRQALETAIHRVDAERALGPASPIDPALAADGVGEVVDVLHPRQVRLGRATEPAAALRLTTDDGSGTWLIAGPSPRPISADPPRDCFFCSGAAPTSTTHIYGSRIDSGRRPCSRIR